MTRSAYLRHLTDIAIQAVIRGAATATGSALIHLTCWWITHH
ncbi:hypothetical protein [Actinomadura sp. KC216]|nr:hypothetical protein [Actinomadura sp. KC216]